MQRKDCIKTLPLLEEAKMIVIDEGLEALYARMLIAGWMHAWSEKNLDYNVDLLSFCNPKFWYKDEPKPFMSKNMQLHDYYNINVDKMANDSENLQHILQTITSCNNNIVIVDCLSSLALYVGLAKTLWFIENLSKQVSQLICIYKRDFMQNKIPAIETLGTTYVKLEKYVGITTINSLVYSAMIVHRKPGGSVLCQKEVITQDNTTYQITVGSITTPSDHKDQTNQSVKIESSFRIEINAEEMEQRDKTPLPYTISAANTSKIHYQPDDVDDIDEEDPDDDLCI